MKRTTISLPDDLAVVVEREARRRGTSVSAVTRDALAEHFGVSGDEPRDVPFAGLITRGAPLPATEAEALLAAHWAHDIEADRGE